MAALPFLSALPTPLWALVAALLLWRTIKTNLSGCAKTSKHF
jgi:hypothetical protein